VPTQEAGKAPPLPARKRQVPRFSGKWIGHPGKLEPARGEVRHLLTEKTRVRKEKTVKA